VIFQIKNADNLEYFSSALSETGLDYNLEGPGPYLVFAPTDEAFEKLKSDQLEEVLSLELSKLMSYHISATSGYDKYRFKDPGSTLSVKTLCNDCNDVTVKSLYTDRVLVNDDAVVYKTIETCNGILVIIDDVLVPRQDGDYDDDDQPPRRRIDEVIECSVHDPTCCDLPPPEFTCIEQKIWDKCEEPWMVREKYCRYTCGRCAIEPREDAPDKDCDYDFSHEIKRKKKSNKNKKKTKGRGKRVKSVKKLFHSSGYEYADPCECTKNGISGSVDTGRKGCFTYSARGTGLAWLSWLLDSRGSSAGTDICYVIQPEHCRHAEKSNHFPGARWRRCHK
jgi:hypothetical protein